MEALKENLSEIDFGTSAESFQKSLNAQRELIHNQIDQLKNVVVSQCRLTGVNPLSQEMVRYWISRLRFLMLLRK